MSEHDDEKPSMTPSVDITPSECNEMEKVSLEDNQPAFDFALRNPKTLISVLQERYSKLNRKRDRLLNNFMKSLRKFVEADFLEFCPEFQSASNSERLANFNEWITSYVQHFFGRSIDEEFNQSLYEGKWGGFQFIFGSLISRETMKQMISSSREKAYFYGLQKCFKNSSQKKLAIILKNTHLLYMLDHLLKTERIMGVLALN